MSDSSPCFGRQFDGYDCYTPHHTRQRQPDTQSRDVRTHSSLSPSPLTTILPPAEPLVTAWYPNRHLSHARGPTPQKRDLRPDDDERGPPTTDADTGGPRAPVTDPCRPLLVGFPSAARAARAARQVTARDSSNDRIFLDDKGNDKSSAASWVGVLGVSGEEGRDPTPPRPLEERRHVSGGGGGEAIS